MTRIKWGDLLNMTAREIRDYPRTTEIITLDGELVPIDEALKYALIRKGEDWSRREDHDASVNAQLDKFDRWIKMRYEKNNVPF